MNLMNLYSYPKSWNDRLHGEILERTIKKSYAIKFVLLSLVLPLDLIFFALLFVRRKKIQCLVATEKWLDFNAHLSREFVLASAVPPSGILNCFKIKCNYMPASIIYLPVALGLFLNKNMQMKYTSIVISYVKFIVSHLMEKNGLLIVHSDALPFARAMVVAFNQEGMNTMCVQHGNFRVENIIGEIDGSLSGINIVRSTEDGEIINSANKKTRIIVDQDFFKLDVHKAISNDRKLKVLILGEGYHIINPEFNRKYIDALMVVAKKLEDVGVKVVFRPHPSEVRMNWRARFKKVEILPLSEALVNVSAVIGYSSTLLQESAEAGIPSFYIDVLNNGHELKGRNGITIFKYSDEQELKDKVYSLLETTDVNLADEKYGLDGGKYKGVIKLICEILKASK